jgi:putative phage-type endonuclease
MSFGVLDQILTSIKAKINDNLDMYSKLSLYELTNIKENIYKNLQKDYPELTMKIIDCLFDRLYVNKYVLVNNSITNLIGLEESFQKIKIPVKYKKLFDHFNKLKNYPQPVQKTKEWFDYRYNRITASDTASAIDMNPYEPIESFILKKCDPNFPFLDNENVYHGKKYELIATMIYSHIYNTKVIEFGALPSEKYNFLGASPDGICSAYTLDNQFSKRLGRMLEIKCPVSREIILNGKIVGIICPFYYYCQIQQQLLCCSLDQCDFWQCHIVEYTKEEYLLDNCYKCTNVEGAEGNKILIDNKLKKGIILEFIPRKFTPQFEQDQIKWKSKYIYPDRLDMDESQYNEWIINVMNNYKETYPDIDQDYYFNRIVYWKLNTSHNVTIDRDDKFLESIIPILKETWNKVIYYRKNLDKLEELRVIVEKRKKYVKMNCSYTISNETIMQNKKLFLSDEYKEVKKPTVKNVKNKASLQFLD